MFAGNDLEYFVSILLFPYTLFVVVCEATEWFHRPDLLTSINLHLQDHTLGPYLNNETLVCLCAPQQWILKIAI